jgi:hypothetical protein
MTRAQFERSTLMRCARRSLAGDDALVRLGLSIGFSTTSGRAAWRGGNPNTSSTDCTDCEDGCPPALKANESAKQHPTDTITKPMLVINMLTALDGLNAADFKEGKKSRVQCTVRRHTYSASARSNVILKREGQ